MGISYKPLFRLLVERNMKKTDLLREVGISSATLAKLAKGESISGASIEKLCAFFKCQVQDVVEITWDSVPVKLAMKPHKLKKPRR